MDIQVRRRSRRAPARLCALRCSDPTARQAGSRVGKTKRSRGDAGQCAAQVSQSSTCGSTRGGKLQSPTRYLHLEGGCNFRDVGGHAAVDGRTVRWGCVYRAGVLSYFTSADAERLSALGVRAICDLRHTDEREREPTRWPTPDVTTLTWADGDHAPTVTGRAMSSQPDGEGMRAAMLNLYRNLPRWMAPRGRGLFECVADRRMPVVVHCSAGKDRTGFAVAMLFAALI